MTQDVFRGSSHKRLIRSKIIFTSATLLLALVLLLVWLSGLEVHRSPFKNALLSTTIISIACFLFFSYALYNGFKLKDNLGRITNKFHWGKFSELPDVGFGGGSHSHGFGGDALEAIGAILFGIIAFFFLVCLLWLFGNLVWAFGLFIAAALYWIFFRAVRFVLRHSP